MLAAAKFDRLVDDLCDLKSFAESDTLRTLWQLARVQMKALLLSSMLHVAHCE